jgi:hypothetical protein
MSTRRQFLGTLGKALGAGGVLLPWAGKGALALPVDLGTAAALPVTATPLRVSAEMLRLRDIRHELHEIYLSMPSDFPRLERPDELGNRCGRSKAWREVMRGHYRPTEAQIIGRKNPTWRDCVEIAEVCIHTATREWHGLDTTKPMHALVWAVLSAGGINEVYIPEIGNFSLNEEADR